MSFIVTRHANRSRNLVLGQAAVANSSDLNKLRPWRTFLALNNYASNRTGLLLVDLYNDLLSDGGKLWPQAKTVAKAVNLLSHLRALVEAARRTGTVVFYVPHRRWREGDFDGWRHPG